MTENQFLVDFGFCSSIPILTVDFIVDRFSESVDKNYVPKLLISVVDSGYVRLASEYVRGYLITFKTNMCNRIVARISTYKFVPESRFSTCVNVLDFRLPSHAPWRPYYLIRLLDRRLNVPVDRNGEFTRTSYMHF